MSTEILYTPREVAEKLKLHLNTVYRYLEEGTLKGRLLAGNTWRITESDLAEFLKGDKPKEVSNA